MWIGYYISIVFVIISTLGYDRLECEASMKLPDDFKLCHLGPDFEKCLKPAIEESLPLFDKGIPSLGLPALNPLHVDIVDVSRGTGPVSLSVIITDASVYGLSIFTVKSIKWIESTTTLDVVTFSEIVNTEGNFVADGRVILFPIKGEGRANITFYGVTTHHEIFGTFQTIDEETYWMINNYKLDYDVEKMEVFFNNLFNGDKLLGDATNRILNENWKLFFEALKPDFVETMRVIGQNFSQILFSKIPIHNIFLEQ